MGEEERARVERENNKKEVSQSEGEEFGIRPILAKGCLAGGSSRATER